MYRKHIITGITVWFFACWLAVTGSVWAQTVYLIPLEEGQEVPPSGSMASGVCTGVLSADQTEFKVVCRHNVADVTGAHIHNGPAGENGPIIFPFDSPTSPILGTAPVDTDFLNNLQAGNLYVNVHSNAFPGGEIRGQILSPAPLSAVLPLQKGQEVPPSVTPATGECAVAMKADRSELTATCTHNVGAGFLAVVTAAHIHNGPAGENGPVIFPFDSPTSPITGVAPVDTDFLENLISGNLYVNVHSKAFPGGELRGQIPNLFGTIYFAQFGNGGGFSSDIVMTNPSGTDTIAGQVDFTDEMGAELSVGLLSEAENATLSIEPQQVQTSAQFSIAPLGARTISTDGAGDVVAGSARVTADGAVGGVVRFTIPNIGIAGVGESIPVNGALVPVRRQSGGINTGVAIRDTANRDNTVNLTLRDAQGAAVENSTATIMLSPRGRVSQFINELFPNANTDNFQGTLEIRAEGGEIAVIALELGTQAGEFTTLPVTELP
ncbi:CHRD domain-containing protein [Acidobacteria bacterium AH-259-O06]|nr:CHRD domain-containing protein [Acidobacteria bacterium AH-259-O06]